MPGVQVSKSDLAHIFGVDQPTIDHWIQRGLPYIRKRLTGIPVAHNERELVFDTADVINWRLSVSNLEQEW
ncbi:MAG: terminase small subunit [Gammaproteobacteria bacterium]|jgi:phage terminase Nu1 subunit (DNA packaging protein)